MLHETVDEDDGFNTDEWLGMISEKGFGDRVVQNEWWEQPLLSLL